MFEVEIDQQGALKEENIPFKGRPGPGDLSALDFDIIAGSKLGIQPQGLQSPGGGPADGLGDLLQVRPRERDLLEAINSQPS